MHASQLASARCGQISQQIQIVADTLMELSVGGDLDRIRREVIAAVDLPVGNVLLPGLLHHAGRASGSSQ
jgi:thiamine biosynthesis protein ThiC